MIVYGIPNCDTIKKALNWFKANNIMYEFYDFRKLGLPIEKLAEWDSKVGYETILNKKSTTWKELDEHVKEAVKTNTAALQLLQQKTSMIKRPVIEDGNFKHHSFSSMCSLLCN